MRRGWIALALFGCMTAAGTAAPRVTADWKCVEGLAGLDTFQAASSGVVLNNLTLSERMFPVGNLGSGRTAPMIKVTYSIANRSEQASETTLELAAYRGDELVFAAGGRDEIEARGTKEGIRLVNSGAGELK